MIDADDPTAPLVLLEPPGGGRREVPFLVILSGSGVGEMFRIRSPRTVVGRAEDAEIRLLDDGVSREHAQFLLEDSQVVISDLGSTNGTFCNGVRVDAHRVLTDGDQISVGSTSILKFTFRDEFDQAFRQGLLRCARRDGLTGVFNGKYLLERLAGEFRYAKRHRAPFSLLLLDLQPVDGVAGHLGGAMGTTLTFGENWGVRFEVGYRRYPSHTRTTFTPRDATQEPAIEEIETVDQQLLFTFGGAFTF